MLIQRLRFCGLIVFLILAVTSCEGGKEAVTKKVGAVGEFAEVCNSAKYFTSAARYSAEEPHPVVIFSPLLGNFQNDKVNTLTVRGVGEGADGEGIDLNYEPSDPATVQLVACPFRVKEGKKITTCTLTNVTADLYQARYRVDVYAVKKGHRLGSTQITAVNDVCPANAATNSDNPRVYSAPTPVQYQDALKPFVETNKGGDSLASAAD